MSLTQFLSKDGNNVFYFSSKNSTSISDIEISGVLDYQQLISYHSYV